MGAAEQRPDEACSIDAFCCFMFRPHRGRSSRHESRIKVAMASVLCRAIGDCPAAISLHGGRCTSVRRCVVSKSTADLAIGGKKVAIVGGSISGFMVATHMVQLGAKVDVYATEKFPHTVLDGTGEDMPSWPRLISASTTDALESVGMKPGFDAQHKCDSIAIF